MRASMTRRLAARICLLLAAVPLGTRGAEAPVHFRLGMSENMISTDVNEGDAKLAMEAWRAAVAKQSGIVVDLDILPIAKLVRAVQQRQVDAFTTTAVEFPEVENYASHYLVMDEASAKGGDEYLLLVHDDSGIRSVGELRHKTLNVFDHPKMCLASIWLESLLSSSNSGATPDFFGRITTQTKLSRVVLPVFFRQTDACLVTRRGFGTMCELNPQLGRKLRVVASSPKLISSVMTFHKDLPADRRQTMQTAILSLSKTAAGQQALILFETSQLIAGDSSVLRNTLDLLKAHDQLRLKAASRK